MPRISPLGTQLRTHIVRRYGVDFEPPGPRMRDYVLAVKACFAGFRGEPLEHRGEFYELTWLNRQWSPGPIDVPDPKVDIAAVNPWMLRMAGEVADGVAAAWVTFDEATAACAWYGRALVAVGLIGQISIVNTFVHVQAPYEAALLRTFHGWWIGILVSIPLSWWLEWRFRRKVETD